jgi:hypothetical protein
VNRHFVMIQDGYKILVKDIKRDGVFKVAVLIGVF